MDRHEQTLRLATELAARLSRLVELLEERAGVEPALIGATAAALHGYIRATVDLDFAVAVNASTLGTLASHLRAEGLDARFEPPDAQDSLGGVLRVESSAADPIELVNYVHPSRTLPSVGIDALASSVRTALGLRVVTLEFLVALKLYAGGPKSELDVVELLRHNPHADRAAIAQVCTKYGLGDAFERLSLASPPQP